MALRRARTENDAAALDLPPSSVSQQVVADLAATIGPQPTDKSCRICGLRKVKCDRTWPECQRCRDRGDACSFGSFVPVAALPTGTLGVTLQTGEDGQDQVRALQSRIAHLETELARLQAREAASLVDDTSNLAMPATELLLSTTSPMSEPPSRLRRASSCFSHEIAATFRLGAGLGDERSTPEQRSIVDSFLRRLAARNPENEQVLVGANEEGVGTLEVAESSTEWGLARTAMATMLSVHLVQSFFSSCCGYLPVFLPWHSRQHWLLSNIDHLPPSDRVAVAAFSALGARASPHSAILGIELPTPLPIEHFGDASAAGSRRQQACQSLQNYTLDLAHRCNVADDVSNPNLEALLVVSQLLIFNESVPRRSRTSVLAASSHFKELRASHGSQQNDLLEHVALPLLSADALASAYTRRSPIITSHDMSEHFVRPPLPDPTRHNLRADMTACLNEQSDIMGLPTHIGIWRACLVLFSWVTTAQRAFATAAKPRPGGPPPRLSQHVQALWALLDEAHDGAVDLQQMLIHLDRPPAGCAKDGCSDQHLRFITRLDKDVLDLFFLAHTLVIENLGREGGLIAETGQSMYLESDTRVRKALKLTAFYSKLYITSRDPHMTYHVFWQLEVLPSWPEMAVQQFGEPDGPGDPNLALTPSDLDWLDRGLVTASFYHPCAVPRLQALRRGRALRVAPPLSAGSGNRSALVLPPQVDIDYASLSVAMAAGISPRALHHSAAASASPARLPTSPLFGPPIPNLANRGRSEGEVDLTAIGPTIPSGMATASTSSSIGPSGAIWARDWSDGSSEPWNAGRE